MTLIYLSIAWLVGVALGTWLRPPWPVPAALGLLSSLLLVLWRGRARSPRALGLLLVAALGALRWALAQPSWGPADVAFYVDQAVQLRGTVVGEADTQPGGVTFPLEVEVLCPADGTCRPGQGQVLVQGERFLEVGYGDRLLLTGQLARPRSTGGFSYRDYLARQGIAVLLKDASVIGALPGAGGAFLTRGFYALRGWARGRLEAFLPEPAASLLVGILLGSRTSIPPEIQEAFARSGTSHILAISGWNINIVAAFLAAAGRRLPRRVSLCLVLLGIGLYALLVGAGAAVLRAALMGALYVIAQQVGRPGHGVTALLASAWAMTLWNPLLLEDLGFQLSFAATLGMLLFVPVWTEMLFRWPRFLSESLAATISSQLVTWPLIALYFRQFSLVVPLSNFLGCPALAPLMLLGALTLFLGGLPGVGVVLRGLTWLVSSYLLGVVNWTGGLSWAAVQMPVLGAGFLVVYYMGVGLWWYQRFPVLSFQFSVLTRDAQAESAGGGGDAGLSQAQGVAQEPAPDGGGLSMHGDFPQD